MAAIDEVVIERQVCIKTSGKPWVVDKIDVVDCTEFIQLAQADRNFLRFITGKVVAKKGIFNWSGLQAIRRLREKASVEALTCSDSVFENQHLQKRAKKEAVTKKKELPNIVTIQLPAIGDLAELSVKVIPSLDMSAVLSVELKPDVLTHIRALLVAGNAQDQDAAETPTYRRESVPSSVIRWHSSKSAYVATRVRGDVKRCKIFRPNEMSSPSKREAKESALEWIDAEDDEGVAENENVV